MSRRRRRPARAALAFASDIAPLALVTWGSFALLDATAADRPRVAAIAMFVALLPALLQRAGRSLLGIWIVAGSTALAALALVDPSSPRYWIAVPLAIVHAIWLGFVAVYFGIFDAYASSDRDSWRALTAGAIPALLSAVAGLVLAVAAVRAATTGH